MGYGTLLQNNGRQAEMLSIVGRQRESTCADFKSTVRTPDSQPWCVTLLN
jgi:hypothetical protein